MTGTAQLAAHTHLPAFKVAAVIAYAGLLPTWILVAIRIGQNRFVVMVFISMSLDTASTVKPAAISGGAATGRHSEAGRMRERTAPA